MSFKLHCIYTPFLKIWRSYCLILFLSHILIIFFSCAHYVLLIIVPNSSELMFYTIVQTFIYDTCFSNSIDDNTWVPMLFPLLALLMGHSHGSFYLF